MSTSASISRILVGVLTLAAMTSCGSHALDTARSYTPGNEIYGFTSSSVSASYAPGQVPETIDIVIERDRADRASTLVLTSAKGLTGFAPAVTFAPGETKATLTLSLSSLRPGAHLSDTIFMAPDFKTRANAGFIALDLTVGYTWTRLTDSRCSYALLTDDLISPAVGGTSATFPVMIEEALEAPGMYRLINPLGAYTSEECDIIIDATNPSEVIVTRQNTGIDLGHGKISIESLGAYHLENGRRPSTIRMAGYYGTLENGIITFKGTESFYMHSGSERNRTNINGTFRVVLPSMVAQIEPTVSKADYALGVAYYQSPSSIPAGSMASR